MPYRDYEEFIGALNERRAIPDRRSSRRCLSRPSSGDSTWLGRGGFFHSEQMHVVERFTRQGNVILYDVTVEDPQVLVEPWVLPTRTLRRNNNPDAGLQRERSNCEVRTREHLLADPALALNILPGNGRL